MIRILVIYIWIFRGFGDDDNEVFKNIVGKNFLLIFRFIKVEIENWFLRGYLLIVKKKKGIRVIVE